MLFLGMNSPGMLLGYLLAQINAHLLADSLGHAHGSHPARLRAAHRAEVGVAVLVEVLRHLHMCSSISRCSCKRSMQSRCVVRLVQMPCVAGTHSADGHGD